jgi:hypothetical protein
MSAGEISPALYQRTDLARYSSALRRATNVFIKKGGGATNRAGTKYIHGAAPIQEPGPYDDTGPFIGENTRLVPWDALDGTQAYVLEFTNNFIRFYKNGSLITVDTVSDWSSATAYVVGDIANLSGTNYYCKLANTNQTPPNSTYWHAMNGFEYSIPSPFTSGLLADRGSFDYSQNSQEMKVVQGDTQPIKITRVSDTNWKIVNWNIDNSTPARYGVPTVNPPTNLAASATGSGTQHTWVVTAVTEDGQESLMSNSVDADASGTGLTWTAATMVTGYPGNIRHYNIYHRYVTGGDFYYEGTTVSTGFYAPAFVLPEADTPTVPRTRPELNLTPGVSTPGGFPKKIGEFQQRTLIGNFYFNTQAAYASVTGAPLCFTRKNPGLDNDSILFQVRGPIRSFLDIGALVVFAETGEWIIEGNSNGSITPTATFPKQFSYYGASNDLKPLVVGADAVYVQAQGNVVRSLGFDIQSGGRDGLRDSDLTAFAEHLFEGHTIVSWAYQKNPNSTILVVRDDGVLLSCTYIKEQQILAWTKHETDGEFEQVCSIPEGSEYGVYFIVKRNVNGADIRYIERLHTRVIDDIEDAVFLDCSITFDGTNTGTGTMLLSGGTNWDQDETLLLRSSEIFFSDLEVGNQIWMTGTDGIKYRLSITAFIDDIRVSVRPDKTIPLTSGLRDTAVTTWARAISVVTGIDHLEDKEVSVFADGEVVSNPNKLSEGETALTVADGAITLPECHVLIHVGLPYISDIETLDVDTTNGETLIDKRSLVTDVSMHVQDTRGLWVGDKAPSDDDEDPLENLNELKIREEEDWGTPTRLVTDIVDIPIKGHWNSRGRVFIRQIDPLPMTILSIAPSGLFPFRGGK